VYISYSNGISVFYHRNEEELDDEDN